MPTAHRFEPALRAPDLETDELEQEFKDARLVEFLNLVAIRGCGELDPEPAALLLEESDWDVAEAFEHLAGMPLADASRASGLSDLEHLRFQQEEWGRTLAAVEVPQASAHRRGERILPAVEVHRASAHRHGELDRRAHRGYAGHSGAAVEPPRRRSEQQRGMPVDPDEDEREFGRLGVPELHDDSYMEGDEEMLQLQALMNVLADAHDEAELQDAVRRSSLEAYTGGYSVPPAKEDVVANCTQTFVYSSGCRGESQCAVCLSEFEAGDSVRQLQCVHRFHMACVDTWLSQSGACPVCKHVVGVVA